MIYAELAVFLGCVGAAMGSFTDAFAWRLHERKNMVSDRSECEHCHHKLAPSDLIPIFSWLALGGKCRYCHAQINPLVPLVELGMAVLFVLSFVYWPLGFGAWQAIALFVLWLLYLTGMGVLVVYDARWMILPDKIVLPLIGAGFVDAALRVSLQPQASLINYILYAGYGIIALAGVYGLLYAASKGKWVGFGDVKLCVFMGAVLGWQGALLTLGLANVIGFLVVIPGLLGGKLSRTSHVPFGPFLIAAFIITGLFGASIINWYIRFIGL